MAQPAWVPHCAAYCVADAPGGDAAHAAARTALEAVLRDGSAQLLEMARARRGSQPRCVHIR
jgi:hypothetical protein